jgi:hypothetical protein
MFGKLYPDRLDITYIVFFSIYRKNSPTFFLIFNSFQVKIKVKVKKNRSRVERKVLNRSSVLVTEMGMANGNPFMAFMVSACITVLWTSSLAQTQQSTAKQNSTKRRTDSTMEFIYVGSNNGFQFTKHDTTMISTPPLPNHHHHHQPDPPLRLRPSSQSKVKVGPTARRTNGRRCIDLGHRVKLCTYKFTYSTPPVRLSSVQL